MTRKKVIIAGGTGYGAAELIKRTLMHPQLELVAVTSVDEVGKNVGDIHLNLAGRTNLKLIQIPLDEAVKSYKAEIVFLALPHKVTFQVVPQILGKGLKIVDMSGDYRLDSNETYETYYKTKHSNPENLSRFAYGIPELFSDSIKSSDCVASPGCFATSIILGLAPLAKRGWLQGASIKTVAATGSSGSGALASAGTHHPLRANNLRIYLPLEHQHLPEIEMALKDSGAKDFELNFVPVSAPLSRGILANSLVDIPESITATDVESAFEETYGGRPFVKLMKGRKPEVVGVKGTNFCEIGWTLSPRLHPNRKTRTLLVTSALDNLVKGGAGQAMQNLNVMMGFDETSALNDFGTWP